MVFGVFALLMAACGGGGSNSTPSQAAITVTFTPPTLTATFPGSGQSLNLVEIPISCTAGNLPNTPVYAFILQDHDILGYTQQAIYSKGGGTFGANLLLNTALAPGVYTGGLQLILAKNSDGTSPYAVSGGTLPYTLTVTSGITIECKVNGVVVNLHQSSPGQPFTTSIHNGDLVQLVSSVPVMWGSSQGGAMVSNEVSTTTSWQANVLYSGSASTGYGVYDVSALTFSSPQAQVTVSIGVSSN